jgi:predicted DNA-binding WGR domain protein
MRRLENEDEEKFWEAWIKDDLIFCYRYGKIGSSGHTKLKKFRTRAEAEAELEETLAKKLEEGFEEPGTDDTDDDATDDTDDDATDDTDHDDATDDDATDDTDHDDATDDETDDTDHDDATDDTDHDETDDETKETNDETKETNETDETDETDHDETDDDETLPRNRRRGRPLVVVEPHPIPSLPARIKRANASAPTPERRDGAVRALEQLRVATAAGSRSWRLARLARRARHALEAFGGAPLATHEAVARALDVVTEAVIAPTKRLPLEDALTMLWVVDVATYARIVARWRARMLDSAVTPSIGVLFAALENIPDQELAVHVGTALVNRRLSPAAFHHWFARLKPFLVEALKTTGGLDTFRAALRPGNDAILKARVEEVAL